MSAKRRKSTRVKKAKKLLGISKNSDFTRFVYEIDKNTVFIRSFLNAKGRSLKILEKTYEKEKVKDLLPQLTKTPLTKN